MALAATRKGLHSGIRNMFLLFLLQRVECVFVQVEILAPSSREIFCQASVPLVIAVSMPEGGGDLEQMIQNHHQQDAMPELQISLDGRLVAIEPLRRLVELEVDMTGEGVHEIEVHAQLLGAAVSNEAAVMFTIQQRMSSDDLLRHVFWGFFWCFFAIISCIISPESKRTKAPCTALFQ
jgi:hypothetical protein